jgi:hypothetical protein
MNSGHPIAGRAGSEHNALTQWLHLQPSESRAELWLQQNQHYRTRRNTNMQQQLTALTQASSSEWMTA